MTYRYPVFEEQTDALEAAMDPYKLHRETLAIGLYASFGWRKALDFGCGIGRSFAPLGEVAGKTGFDRHLTAIDPDAERVAAAARAAGLVGAGRLKIDTMVGSQGELQRASPEAKYDLILCRQVLGHVTRSRFEEILRFLVGSLDRPGSLLLLIPFCTQAKVRQAYGARYVAGQDFYFAADLARVDDPASHRIVISPDEFDELVKQPRGGLLPVRSFSVPALRIDGWHACPADVAVPAALNLAGRGDMQALALAYTVHEFEPALGAVFGDMLVRASFL